MRGFPSSPPSYYTPHMASRAFEEIGFSCNPFRALTREEWVRAAVLPEAVRRSAQTGEHLQILGDAGSGKTTALLALADEFHRAGRSCAYEYIPPKSDRFRTVTNGLDVFLLDEAQRLSRGLLFIGNERAQLIRAAKAGVRLILGSHEDLAALFSKADLPLQSVRLSPADANGLAGILRQRLSLFALSGDRARFSEESVDWLATIFAGDLRSMEYFLYDFFQTQRPTGVILSDPLREALPFFIPPAVGQE